MLRFTGLVASALFWVVASLSIAYNPWFSFTRDAFSDLGGAGASQPWIYNYGLMITALFATLFSVFLVDAAKNKVEMVGGALMLVAGIFLALIGVYHSGTMPHTFVSSWFFVQADLAIIVWGAGLIIEKRNALGAASVVMGVVGPLLAEAVRWPSAAVVEAYGIILISAWIVLALRFDKG